MATIEHKPGQIGSLTVYAALAAQHGGAITPDRFVTLLYTDLSRRLK